MPYLVEISTKNETLEFIKAILPVISALVGIFLGFLLNVLWERRKDKKRLKNISKVFFLELVKNYQILMRYTPMDTKQEKLTPEASAQAILHLLHSVYDLYLDRLCDLEIELVHSIYNAYAQIGVAMKRSREYSERIQSGDAVQILKVSQTGKFIPKILESTTKAIRQSLILFDGGKKVVEHLENQKGDGLETLNELTQKIDS